MHEFTPMAASNHINNTDEIDWKANLLHKLIRKHLPDEKHPLESPKVLSGVVSKIQTNGLLSESLDGESSDKNVAEKWKAEVDLWVNRVLLLASSNMPDKCWAGTCLLGVTIQECSPERFLASYNTWFQKLQSHLQPPADSHFVKVASCASLSDLFTRLATFPKVKKDATSLGMKLAQAVLKLLKEDSPDSVWDVAVSLLCILINFFPASVQSCYDNVESAVALKIMSGKCSEKTEKMLCDCLALLPKAKGDEESWSLMMQRILYAVIIYLNNAFEGVEEESKGNEAVRVLVPPGNQPPPLCGGQTTKQYECLHISSVCSLMRCCCTMLTRSYPVQVRVPIRSLVALSGRVLMVGGSFTQSLIPSLIDMRQEEFHSELRNLHICSLELLAAVIEGVRSQLLPHAAEVVRLVTEYFKRCKDPVLRIKIYSIIRTLLMSMGFGMAVYVTQDIVSNAFKDLNTDTGGTSSGARSKGSDTEPSLKKRKHGRSTFEEQPADLDGGKTKDPAQLSVKIAALDALETLLNVGGALGAESWRPSVDYLLITVATNACKMGWAQESRHSSEHAPTWIDFQLAALRALLASLLSPARTRPPHLGRALKLFSRGSREIGTRISELCVRALSSLEAVIHPRDLPLVDLSSTNGASGVFPDSYSHGNKQNTQFSMGKGHDESYLNDDDVYETFVAEDDEIRHAGKNAADALLPGGGRIHDASTSTSEKKEDEIIMVEVRQSEEESMKQIERPPFGSSAEEAQPASKNVIESRLSDRVGGGLVTSKDGSEARVADVLQTKGYDAATMSKSFLEKRKRDHDSGDDESIVSLPDIVDADPDSD